MKKQALMISLVFMAGAVAAAPANIMNSGITPSSPFYSLDRFSESLELTVAKAPVVGSQELEAKVRANHAEERLSEAKKMIEKNRSEKAEKLMEQYNRQLNHSIESANRANKSELSDRLRTISNNHVEVLKEVQKKVPEQAQKGIQNAIENSQRAQSKLGKPERAGEKARPEAPEKEIPETEKPEQGQPEATAEKGQKSNGSGENTSGKPSTDNQKTPAKNESGTDTGNSSGETGNNGSEETSEDQPATGNAVQNSPGSPPR